MLEELDLSPIKGMAEELQSKRREHADYCEVFQEMEGELASMREMLELKEEQRKDLIKTGTPGAEVFISHLQSQVEELRSCIATHEEMVSTLDSSIGDKEEEMEVSHSILSAIHNSSHASSLDLDLGLDGDDAFHPAVESGST